MSHVISVHPDLSSPYRIGGTVSFASVTAVRLGRRPTVVTRAAATTDLSELPDEVDLHVLPLPDTTTFANVYTEHGRIQYCYRQALPITAADITANQRHPGAVLLGPLVDEIVPAVASIFAEESLVVAVPKGGCGAGLNRPCLQQTLGKRRCHPTLSDVLVLSLEDIAYDVSPLEPFFARVPLVVLTEYRDGITLYRRTERWRHRGDEDSTTPGQRS